MKRLFAAAALLASFTHVSAGEMSLYSRPDFRGPHVTVRGTAANFVDLGFNDRASSIIVHSGAWEVCEHKDFGGYCAVLEPGRYEQLSRFSNAISSAREVDRWRDRGGDRAGRRDDYRGSRQDDERRDNRDGGRRDERGDQRADYRGDERRGPPVELFAGREFGGDRVALGGDVNSLRSRNFNDRAGSLIVREGAWQVCEHDDYRGRCVVYGPGRHASLGGLDNQASSVRRVR